MCGLNEKQITDFICWIDKELVSMEIYKQKEKKEEIKNGKNPYLDYLQEKIISYELVRSDLEDKLYMLKNNL